MQRNLSMIAPFRRPSPCLAFPRYRLEIHCRRHTLFRWPGFRSNHCYQLTRAGDIFSPVDRGTSQPPTTMHGERWKEQVMETVVAVYVGPVWRPYVQIAMVLRKQLVNRPCSDEIRSSIGPHAYIQHWDEISYTWRHVSVMLPFCFFWHVDLHFRSRAPHQGSIFQITTAFYCIALPLDSME